MTNLDRFAYGHNMERATHYSEWRSAYWPPSDDYHLFNIDIARNTPAFGSGFQSKLDVLRDLVEQEWTAHKVAPRSKRAPMDRAAVMADCLFGIAQHLDNPNDRVTLELRARALQGAYTESALAQLAVMDEEVAVVVGRISTWFGKQIGGLPTAFACVRDAGARAAVAAAAVPLADAERYLKTLHVALQVGSVPAFAATRVFFMCGEGNRHPKHIAYFLPEDEGVKCSPFKKTYYFANTHAALVSSVSLSLARRYLDLGIATPKDADALMSIPALGVLAHEMGHFVYREGTTYNALNAADRWASVVLQETAADVFGFLALVDVIAPALELRRSEAVLYHLAECLRYTDRGFGSFPDSDGMFLQLNYLQRMGALQLDDSATPRLVGDPNFVIAGFRSLARVLADTLLAGDIPRSLALYNDFGPRSSGELARLIDSMKQSPPKSIEYLQETAPLSALRSTRSNTAEQPTR